MAKFCCLFIAWWIEQSYKILSRERSFLVCFCLQVNACNRVLSLLPTQYLTPNVLKKKDMQCHWNIYVYNVIYDVFRWNMKHQQLSSLSVVCMDFSPANLCSFPLIFCSIAVDNLYAKQRSRNEESVDYPNQTPLDWKFSLYFTLLYFTLLYFRSVQHAFEWSLV